MSTGGEAPHHQLAPRGALCNTSPLTITLRVPCIFAAPEETPAAALMVTPTTLTTQDMEATETTTVMVTALMMATTTMEDPKYLCYSLVQAPPQACAHLSFKKLKFLYKCSYGLI
jgi:hypothetical protein